MPAMPEAGPPPQVVGAKCQAYGFTLTEGCGTCVPQPFCECARSTLFDMVPSCTVWGACVKGFDCTKICSQANLGQAYADLAACLMTRACASDSECLHGSCVNGACSAGQDGAHCSTAANCTGAHCVSGACTSGKDQQACVEDTDCQNRVCVTVPTLDTAHCADGKPNTFCNDDGDCLAGKCLDPNGDKPLDFGYKGQCTSGELYELCAQDSDCAKSGVCLLAPDLKLRCYQGGIGQFCRDAKDCVTGACSHPAVADAGADADAGAVLGTCVTGPP